MLGTGGDNGRSFCHSVALTGGLDNSRRLTRSLNARKVAGNYLLRQCCCDIYIEPTRLNLRAIFQLTGVHPGFAVQSNPIPAWSRNNSASRTYPRKVSKLLCRLTSIILKTDAPRRAADVRNPALNECPLNSFAFNPARRAHDLTISATARSDSLRSRILPALLIGRNIGPSEMRTTRSHSRSAITGQAALPGTMATVVPSPSWSVLLLRIVRRRPPSQKSRSFRSNATSSERRNAPAKPSRSRARSRIPLALVPAMIVSNTDVQVQAMSAFG